MAAAMLLIPRRAGVLTRHTVALAELNWESACFASKRVCRISYVVLLTVVCTALGHLSRLAAQTVTPSGAHQTSVSIEVPPYHGLEPRLTLVYNSSAGSGFIGAGWSLSGLSTIQRVSHGKGAPTYDTVDISQSSADMALLDGMELLRCYSWMPSPSCHNPSSESSHYIYYATKTESFQRIAYDPTVLDGAWYVWHKDGTKLSYYTSFVTRSGPFRWFLASVQDRLGNKVDYVTLCDQAVDPNNWPVECYPDFILYNGNVIQFYRENRPDQVTYAMGSGMMAVMRYRLKTIERARW